MFSFFFFIVILWGYDEALGSACSEGYMIHMFDIILGKLAGN